MKKHKIRLISKKKFDTFLETHPEHRAAKPAFDRWRKIAVNATWACFADVRETFGDADPVDKSVVFNVGGNKYRVVAEIRYNLKARLIYIRHVLTHEEYSKGKWKR